MRPVARTRKAWTPLVLLLTLALVASPACATYLANQAVRKIGYSTTEAQSAKDLVSACVFPLTVAVDLGLSPLYVVVLLGAFAWMGIEHVVEPERRPSPPGPSGPPPGRPPAAPGLQAPNELLPEDLISADDLAPLLSSSASARKSARAGIVEALEGGKALVLVSEEPVSWSVAPRLALPLLGVDAEMREALAAISGDEGARELARAKRSGSPDAIARAVDRFPFDPAVAAAECYRAELLLERGDLDEAVVALEEAVHGTDPIDTDLLERARKLLALTHALMKPAGSAGELEPAPVEALYELVGETHGLRIEKARVRPASDVPRMDTVPHWRIAALDDTQTIRWKIDLPPRYTPAVTMGSGRVYCAAARALVGTRPELIVAAIDASNGCLVWERAYTGSNGVRTVALTRSGNELRLRHENVVEVLDARTGEHLR